MSGQKWLASIMVINVRFFYFWKTKISSFFWIDVCFDQSHLDGTFVENIHQISVNLRIGQLLHEIPGHFRETFSP